MNDADVRTLADRLRKQPALDLRPNDAAIASLRGDYGPLGFGAIEDHRSRGTVVVAWLRITWDAVWVLYAPDSDDDARKQALDLLGSVSGGRKIELEPTR